MAHTMKDREWLKEYVSSLLEIYVNYGGPDTLKEIAHACNHYKNSVKESIKSELTTG